MTLIGIGLPGEREKKSGFGAREERGWAMFTRSGFFCWLARVIDASHKHVCLLTIVRPLRLLLLYLSHAAFFAPGKLQAETALVRFWKRGRAFDTHPCTGPCLTLIGEADAMRMPVLTCTSRRSRPWCSSDRQSSCLPASRSSATKSNGRQGDSDSQTGGGNPCRGTGSESQIRASIRSLALNDATDAQRGKRLHRRRRRQMHAKQQLS